VHTQWIGHGASVEVNSNTVRPMRVQRQYRACFSKEISAFLRADPVVATKTAFCRRRQSQRPV
jgi:hypothetical protein